MLEALEASGARVTLFAADVSDEGAVTKLMAELEEMPPLAGVIHAAGVLDDATLAQQNWERFRKVMAPKVAGSWNLHRATRHHPLDFFVLFSSVASLLGAQGQANYAAANAFLDALAQHRRLLGLPAVSINWGPWAGGGMAGQLGNRERDRWVAQGVHPLEPSQALDLLAAVLTGGEGMEPSDPAAAQVGAMNISWPQYRSRFPAGSEPRLLAELDRQDPGPKDRQQSVPSDLLNRLKQAPSDAVPELLAEHLQEQTAMIVGADPRQPLPRDTPINELGLDSLMAVELRNALGASLGVTLPAALLAEYPTLSVLQEHLLEQLASKGMEGSSVM